MTGRAILVSLIVLFATAAAIAWLAEIYGGRFWDAIFRYQTLIAGIFAVVAAVVGAIALVLVTRTMLAENRDSELRQRKARARGIANLVGAELIRRSKEAKLLHEECRRALARDPPGHADFMFTSVFREERVFGLNDELVHVAEFAPQAALRALEDLSSFRDMVAAVRPYGDGGGVCLIPPGEVAMWEDWSQTVWKDLVLLGAELNRLPQLADRPLTSDP